ncbi:MAG: hypothetical protein CVT99_13620 [Bacteroidetes bacterium HGW-Bacteroidetes-16]|jgi:hypothetical protein|nr:MAG: hypothetical protein CVT99_13620 [Bacteroidetes bacterium HGW-Bacteroidetes-16]
MWLIKFGMVRRLLILLIFFLLFGCVPNSEEAFVQMKTLEGNWSSSGNVLINLQWKSIGDSALKGRMYTLLVADTTCVEQYIIFKRNDSVFAQLGNCEGYLHPQLLLLSKSRGNSYWFENMDRPYPNRIVFEWGGDSLFVFRKENSRGNKPIEFQMKRN